VVRRVNRRARSRFDRASKNSCRINLSSRRKQIRQQPMARFVNLGAAFVADEQSFELVQVREGAPDDRADRAERRAVCGAAAGDQLVGVGRPTFASCCFALSRRALRVPVLIRRVRPRSGQR
jgi:hypothetical protein